MPFSRVLTPLFGGGDEIFALTTVGVSHPIAWIASVVLVFALAVPTVARVYAAIGNRPKPLWLAGLLFVPFLVDRRALRASGLR